MVQHDKEILNSIYGWYGKANGKAERPKCFLPECSLLKLIKIKRKK